MSICGYALANVCVRVSSSRSRISQGLPKYNTVCVRACERAPASAHVCVRACMSVGARVRLNACARVVLSML